MSKLQVIKMMQGHFQGGNSCFIGGQEETAGSTLFKKLSITIMTERFESKEMGQRRFIYSIIYNRNRGKRNRRHCCMV